MGAKNNGSLASKRSTPTTTGKKTLFAAGDKVVYPGHGVGEITDLQSKSIAGTEAQFFEIHLVETGMKLMVPVAQAGSVGLRKVVDRRSIPKIYAILKEKRYKTDSQTWNRRFREYSSKIKSGSVYEIAEVIRDLSVLSGGKELSFGEKKMLDTARQLLASEIAASKSRPQEAVLGEISELFG